MPQGWSGVLLRLMWSATSSLASTAAHISSVLFPLVCYLHPILKLFRYISTIRTSPSPDNCLNYRDSELQSIKDACMKRTRGHQFARIRSIPIDSSPNYPNVPEVIIQARRQKKPFVWACTWKYDIGLANALIYTRRVYIDCITRCETSVEYNCTSWKTECARNVCHLLLN